ncbi:hypothetical protein [uncultured Limosilactobacillus sp.]|uniref:hypothetical protein n=1 Tax=uncultured Limosilactobacillus sp. TaxID=2837629 RepID=UPI0025F25A78|nr:hypothetical protein [uncultured Limosilactobacillus sp.]
MWNQFIHILGMIIGWTMIIPMVSGSVVVVISRANKRLSISLGGFYGQIILGGLGIIIHELSHLITALLFGHRIKRVSLLHIPNANVSNDRGLGYVSHVWNDKSYYQKIGNFFIGIAPVIGCAFVMLLSTRWLVPSIYCHLFGPINGGQLTDFSVSWWRFLLWIILMTNISIGGFDLSTADLQNSRQGLVTLVVFLVIISLGLSLVETPQRLGDQLVRFVHPLMGALGFSIVVNITLWLVLRLIVNLKRH